MSPGQKAQTGPRVIRMITQVAFSPQPQYSGGIMGLQSTPRLTPPPYLCYRYNWL